MAANDKIDNIQHVHSSAATAVTSAEGKIFIPLENNPAVMTSLAHKLGLSASLSFYDVLSLDEPGLLALLPRPCHALLFTFPGSPTSEASWRAEDASIGTDYTGSGSSEPVLWYRQTVEHACGLIGLLHCSTNGTPKSHIQEDSFLAQLVREVTPLPPKERAQWLYDSEFLEKAHMEAAYLGDSRAPSTEEPVGHAYVAFVKGKDGQLWELEGRRSGPLQRTNAWGKGLTEKEDLLSETALDMGPRKLVRRELDSGSGNVQFSCLALCPTAVEDN